MIDKDGGNRKKKGAVGGDVKKVERNKWKGG